MAEVVALAASIASLLQIAGQITQLSYSYVSDIKNAPKTQKQYLQEVSALTDVLFRAEQAIQEAEATGLLPSRPASLNDEVLRDCHKNLSALHLDLEKRLRRVLWPFQEKQLRKYIDILHRFRAIFADFLSTNILIATNATYKKVTIINQEQVRHQLLASLPTSDAYLRSRPTACTGTGKWFLNCKTVEEWRCGSPTLLWCYGPPGVGKSLLSVITIEHLQEKRIEMNSFVIYYFCDFSLRDQQNPLDILQCLLRQLIEQGDGQVVSTLKESCMDPSRLRNLKDLAQILAEACALRPTYLVIDAPDELNEPDGLLCHFKSLVEAGCRVLVTSRDLPNIRNKLQTADKMEVGSNFKDLETYVESRFRKSDIFDEVGEGSGLIHEVALKADTFLLAKLLLDQVLDLTTIRQIRKALEMQPSGLDEAFESSLKRIDSQSKTKSALARRLIGWIIYGKRRLRRDEILCAFAVEEDSDDIHPENFPNPDLLLRLCVGLVVLDKNDGTLGMVHTSAYEFFQNRVLSSKETEIDIAKTCLHYLCMTPLSGGPCKNSNQMSERFQKMPFLDYSARFWGKHVQGEDVEKYLESLVFELLCHEKLRASAFQALHYRDEFKNELSDAFFDSIPTGQEELHVTAYWNFVYTTKILIQRGKHLSPLDSQKWTPLHWACSNSHLAVAEILVRNGADVNVQDSQGWTPLFWAAFVGSLDVVRLLLSNHANYLVRSVLGWTALHWAISRGQYDIVKELLDHHLNYSLGSNAAIRELSLAEVSLLAAEGMSPAGAAADAENPAIFDLLIAHLHTTGSKFGDPAFNEIWSKERFDVPVSNPWRTLTKGERLFGLERVMPDLSGRYRSNSVDEWRLNPIRWKSILLLSAIRDSQFTAVQLLIKTGADVNYSMLLTPLHVAAFRRDSCYAKILLQHGADPGKIDGKGQTALHQAVLNGFIDTIETIIDGGADVNKPVESSSSTSMWPNSLTFGNYDHEFRLESSTPLMQACGFMLKDRSKSIIVMDTTRLLLSNGANPLTQDMDGMTVLHYATFQPFLPLIRLLMDAGAKVELVDNAGRTPLHILAKYSMADCNIEELREIVQLFLQDSQNGLKTFLLSQPAHKSTQETNMSETQTDPHSLEFESLFPVNSNVGIVNKFSKERGGGTVWSRVSEEIETPVTMALKNSCWKIFRIFSNLGAAIPENLPLESILEEAVKDLDPNAVQILVDHGVRLGDGVVMALVDSLASSIEAKTFIPEETFANFTCILAKVVSTGANVDFIDPASKLTPLSIAAEKMRSEKVILELLNSGADAYYRCEHTFDPILTAAIHTNMEGLQCLMKHALNYPKADHWSKYLNSAMQEGADDIWIICICLEKAHVLDRLNDKGQTLMHLAAEIGNCHLINSLLSQNASAEILDSSGWLAVHCAGFSQHAGALQCFLHINQTAQKFKQKDFLDKRDNLGRTMFQVAVKSNIVPLVLDLLELGADVESELEECGVKFPLLYHAARYGYVEVVSALLSYGANVEVADRYGWRSLHIASYNGHTDIVQALLVARADVHAATRAWNNRDTKPTCIYVGNEWTGQPLHLAAMRGDVEIVRLLLEQGADIHASTGCLERNFPGHGPTALFIALDTNTFYNRTGQPLDKRRLTIGQMLFEKGARVDGVVDKFTLQDVLKFKKFPGFWDALRADTSMKQTTAEQKLLLTS